MLIAALQHWRVAVWVVLLALAAGQTVRLDAAREALAQERANHEAAALAAQGASANRTLAVERAHAAAQQRIADDFAREKQKMEDARIADAAVARSLRDRLAAATAKQPAKNHADTVECERDRDRLEALGQLAGEGVELLAEGRNLLQQRDHEVALLLDQIRLDRASCEAPR